LQKRCYPFFAFCESCPAFWETGAGGLAGGDCIFGLSGKLLSGCLTKIFSNQNLTIMGLQGVTSGVSGVADAVQSTVEAANSVISLLQQHMESHWTPIVLTFTNLTTNLNFTGKGGDILMWNGTTYNLGSSSNGDVAHFGKVLIGEGKELIVGFQDGSGGGIALRAISTDGEDVGATLYLLAAYDNQPVYGGPLIRNSQGCFAVFEPDNGPIDVPDRLNDWVNNNLLNNAENTNNSKLWGLQKQHMRAITMNGLTLHADMSFVTVDASSGGGSNKEALVSIMIEGTYSPNGTTAPKRPPKPGMAVK
jgi:hypothetical protein